MQDSSITTLPTTTLSKCFRENDLINLNLIVIYLSLIPKTGGNWLLSLCKYRQDILLDAE